jgi:RNA recognition motif-containing protein
MMQTEPQIERNFNLPSTHTEAINTREFVEVHPEVTPRTDVPGLAKYRNKAVDIARKLKLGLTDCSPPSPPPIFEESHSAPSERRYFVGRLTPAVDSIALREYFSEFGEIVDVFFPKDDFGKPRGFAFITFKHLFKDPLSAPLHVINDREIYIDQSQYKQGEGRPTRTILVSGIINDSTDEALIEHFSKYGEIKSVTRPKESRKKQARWAFVHFADCQSASKALSDPVHSIDGHTLDLRRAYNFHVNEPQVNQEDDSFQPTIQEKKPSPGDNEAVNVKKLLIHNLDFKTTTETLRKHFSKFGTVLDAYIPTVYGTSESKGFGYIVMPASQVNFNFNSHEIDGRLLHISKECSKFNSEKTSTILVSAGPDVMAKVSEQDLIRFFERFGEIISVRKPMDAFLKKASHYAFVEFTTCEAVEAALGK